MNSRRISLPCLFSVVLCMVFATACGGETKQAQCQKVGNIINSLGSVTQTDIGIMSELGLSAAQDLEALELGDKKLSNLRSHLAKSMRTSSEATSKLAKLTGADGSFEGSPEVDAIMAENQKASDDFLSKINATQAYCNGGTVPDELTSTPAS